VSNIFREIKSGRKKWVEYVACMGETVANKTVVGKLHGKMPHRRLWSR
jgi:hypothetical protein